MDWIPAISTSTLLGFVAYLSRNLIITRLTNAVKHEYDGKIESLKSTLRENEESFKAELKAKEAQIDSLRCGALSSLANRQTVLYNRQLKATEQLWGAVSSLWAAKSATSIMATLNFEAVAKEASMNPRLREIFKQLGKGYDIKKLQPIDAHKIRPFVSPMAWAFYSAYEAIIILAVMKLNMIQLGVDKDFSSSEETIKLVKIALPHQEEYIKKFGSKGLHLLLDELETNILHEIDTMLQGEKSDKDSIEQAALIIKESERLMASSESEGQRE